MISAAIVTIVRRKQALLHLTCAGMIRFLLKFCLNVYIIITNVLGFVVVVVVVIFKMW